MATTTKAERLQSPGRSLPRLILAGQAQGSTRNPVWPWQTRGRLTEGCLHAARESVLLCWLLLQNTAVEISTCYKKISRLDEGSKDKQGNAANLQPDPWWTECPSAGEAMCTTAVSASIHYC